MALDDTPVSSDIDTIDETPSGRGIAATLAGIASYEDLVLSDDATFNGLLSALHTKLTNHLTTIRTRERARLGL